MKIQSHFAEEIGEKILHVENETKRELVLDSVSMHILTCYGGDINPVGVHLTDCRIIVTDTSQAINRDIPFEYTVVKTKTGKYISVVDLVGPSDSEKLLVIKRKLMRCTQINSNQFMHLKTRKREVVWPRQIYMAILLRILNFSQSKTGSVFGLDHATARHSALKVDNFIETDTEWRDMFYPAFAEILIQYVDKAESAFDLEWLSKYEK